MSGIRATNTSPELIVRKALFAAGYRFRLHRRSLPGVPDVVMPGRRIAIFIHGCFWHAHAGCKNATLPATRPEFWRKKLLGNAERDQRTIGALHRDGWRVLICWECATRDRETAAALPTNLTRWIEGRARFGELSAPSPE